MDSMNLVNSTECVKFVKKILEKRTDIRQVFYHISFTKRSCVKNLNYLN